MPLQSNYRFSNLLGTVYRQGNVLFAPSSSSLKGKGKDRELNPGSVAGLDAEEVISPVGNRVAVFDLTGNKSRTLSFQNRKNVARIALSPDGNVLISVDEDGRALFVNYRRSVVLHHFNFKKPVRDIKFSPDGRYILVTHGSQVQVWNTPSHLAREFAPFVLHRTYTGHSDDVLSVEWSPDSNYFLTTSKDMTARLYTLNPVEGYRPRTFSGHRDSVLNAFFSKDCRTIYTVSRDGAVFTWRGKKEERDEADSDEDEEDDDYPSFPLATLDENFIANTRWGIQSRHYFQQPSTRVTTCTFHIASSLLIVGFSNGVFGLWEMPSFNNIHTLSLSQEKISSVAVNGSGEWLAFGASKLGQLLVWEWQSESYVLKQQGHYFDMNCLSFSPDGQNIATGGDDGKVKIWNSNSGFCFVTFSEHSSSISAVEFSRQGGGSGQVVFSASLDGTVRAFDLIRYRNFRTFSSPTPVQFNSLAVDPSGEIVAAGGSGGSENFEIYVWSVQTGKILEVLTGHEGPISSLSFSPEGDRILSVSWDRTARLWDVYGRSREVEPFKLNSDGLCGVFRPDGEQFAVSSLDGSISFWEVKDGKQVNLIEGRKDISGGRGQDDRITAANNSATKSFNSLAYTADGTCIIAGGNSKNVCLYDIQEGVLLKRYEVSENLSLDGTEEYLDNRRLTESGVVLDSVDDRGDLEDLEDRLDSYRTLPGVKGGDLSRRKYRPEVRIKDIRFSPTGRSWAAASTEGLLIYSLDDSINFDPFDLDIDITPDTILETIRSREYLKALVMAFRLSEIPILRSVYESIPPSNITLVARKVPAIYVEPLLKFVAGQMEESPHMEFHLGWVREVLQAHGRMLRDRNSEFMPTLRRVLKGLLDYQGNVMKMSEDNTFTMRYLVEQARRKREASQARDTHMTTS